MSQIQRMLYLDTETTGLNPEKNGIWQIGGIVEIDGKIKDKFNFIFAPSLEDEVDDYALKMSGYASEEALRAIKNSSNKAFNSFIAILEKHISKFNTSEKFTLCGYNVGFDDGFLRAWFTKNHEKYYGSYITPYKIDVYTLTALLWGHGKLDIPKLKLETVADHLGIEINAHDALSDIEATYKISKVIINKFMTVGGSLEEWMKEEEVNG